MLVKEIIDATICSSKPNFYIRIKEGKSEINEYFIGQNLVDGIKLIPKYYMDKEVIGIEINDARTITLIIESNTVCNYINNNIYDIAESDLIAIYNYEIVYEETFYDIDIPYIKKYLSNFSEGNKIATDDISDEKFAKFCDFINKYGFYKVRYDIIERNIYIFIEE